MAISPRIGDGDEHVSSPASSADEADGRQAEFGEHLAQQHLGEGRRETGGSEHGRSPGSQLAGDAPPPSADPVRNLYAGLIRSADDRLRNQATGSLLGSGYTDQHIQQIRDGADDPDRAMMEAEQHHGALSSLGFQPRHIVTMLDSGRPGTLSFARQYAPQLGGVRFNHDQAAEILGDPGTSASNMHRLITSTPALVNQQSFTHADIEQMVTGTAPQADALHAASEQGPVLRHLGFSNDHIAGMIAVDHEGHAVPAVVDQYQGLRHAGLDHQQIHDLLQTDADGEGGDAEVVDAVALASRALEHRGVPPNDIIRIARSPNGAQQLRDIAQQHDARLPQVNDAREQLDSVRGRLTIAQTQAALAMLNPDAVEETISSVPHLAPSLSHGSGVLDWALQHAGLGVGERQDLQRTVSGQLEPSPATAVGGNPANAADSSDFRSLTAAALRTGQEGGVINPGWQERTGQSVSNQDYSSTRGTRRAATEDPPEERPSQLPRREE